MTLLIVTLVLFPAVAFVLTLFNLFTWPRGRADEIEPDRVSILIPARNEEGTIEEAVRSALRQEPLEVIVYDDQSTDATPDILRHVQSEDSRLRVLLGVELPDGWVGKPHACHRLAEAARGDILFFMDADVSLSVEAGRRIDSLLRTHEAGVVTAVPRQILGSNFEKLVLPLLHLTYMSWLPIVLVWKSSDPRFLAANGQLLAVRRTVYDDVGGFAAVRNAVVDDMEFCRAVKTAGHRVVFADGHQMASCRMYGSAREVWEGFSKNIYEGIGSTPLFIAVMGLYFVSFILPWIALVASIWFPELRLPALVGVALNLAQRLAITVRQGHPFWSALANPFGVVALIAIAVNSWRWSKAGTIRWAGREYVAKESRNG